jgi:GTP-binding protein
MRAYLLGRDQLRLTLLLVDGEVGPAGQDTEVLAWLREEDVPFQVVATKHDKVKSSKRVKRRRELAARCGLDEGEVRWVSAERGVGIDALRDLVRGAIAVGDAGR